MSEAVLQQILQELQGVNRRLDGVDERLDGMERRFEGIEQRLDGMERRFEGIEQRLDGMERRFEGIEQRLDRVETTLGEVKQAVLETHELVIKNDLKHTAAIEALQVEQDRQGKVLATLSVKVLEHDAEIRELKRAK